MAAIHYLDRQGVCHTVAKELAFPNGIVIRPGSKELLVAESKRNRILVFPVLGPGKLGEYRVLINLPQKGPGQIDNQPDGIALDAEGNLFVAHYGMRQVQVVSPEGKLLRTYSRWQPDDLERRIRGSRHGPTLRHRGRAGRTVPPRPARRQGFGDSASPGQHGAHSRKQR